MNPEESGLLPRIAEEEEPLGLDGWVYDETDVLSSSAAKKPRGRPRNGDLKEDMKKEDFKDAKAWLRYRQGKATQLCRKRKEVREKASQSESFMYRNLLQECLTSKDVKATLTTEIEKLIKENCKCRAFIQKMDKDALKILEIQ